jgi:hypothetical protein
MNFYCNHYYKREENAETPSSDEAQFEHIGQET